MYSKISCFCNSVRDSSSFNVFSPLNLQAKKVRTLRLTSYNIQHGKGLDGKIDHDRLASILHEARTEVAAIQEVDSVTKRNGGVYALDEIGSKLKMYSTFAPAIDFQGESTELVFSVRKLLFLCIVLLFMEKRNHVYCLLQSSNIM